MEDFRKLLGNDPFVNLRDLEKKKWKINKFTHNQKLKLWEEIYDTEMYVFYYEHLYCKPKVSQNIINELIPKTLMSKFEKLLINTIEKLIEEGKEYDDGDDPISFKYYVYLWMELGLRVKLREGKHLDLNYFL